MIRKATENDIPSLLHLLEQVNRVHHEGRPDLFRRCTKYGNEELRAILNDPQTPVFVYDDENGIVLGHAFCKLQSIENDRLLCNRKTLYIDDICVEERGRGQGIGTWLYRHCETFAKSHGCDAVTLVVWTLNPAAVAFYEKLGLQHQKITMEQIL